MEEVRELKIIVKLLDNETKEVYDELEETLFLTEDSEIEEGVSTKSLDEFIEGLVKEVDETCRDNELALIDPETLCTNLAIALILSKDGDIVVDAPVVRIKEGDENEEQE
jgi:hypothetical protein